MFTPKWFTPSAKEEFEAAKEALADAAAAFARAGDKADAEAQRADQRIKALMDQVGRETTARVESEALSAEADRKVLALNAV